MKKQGVTVIGSNPIRSEKFPENPDSIQSNPWMDPIHVQLCLLDFAVTRILMKLFQTSSIAIIKDCCRCFGFKLPSELLERMLKKLYAQA